MTPIGPVTQQVLRRYVLGRQGLWPGRRWAGKEGAAAAINALEGLQLDPVQVVARSHDLTLHSRVAEYEPAHLDDLVYAERRFFDWGGALFLYPMEALPYWRPIMRRKVEEPRYADFAAQNGAVIERVQEEVRRCGPLSPREIEGGERVQSGRARKDTGLALYHLWLAGELMTHSRRGFERVYDLRERVAPAQYDWEASAEDAERFFAGRASGALGMRTVREWVRGFAGAIERRVSPQEGKRLLAERVESGALLTAQVEGYRDLCYFPAADLPHLLDLLDNRVPAAWSPLGTTAEEEVVFLSPLEPVSARGQARSLFDFDYIWEIYKPAAKRKFGPYTLPILYGDTLVARMDPKLDREKGVMVIQGLWLEDEAMARDDRFVAALAGGLRRFLAFHGVERYDLAGVMDGRLRQAISAGLE